MRAFSNWRWHLDEVFVKVNGERRYLWRAVDHEGEVLDVVVTKRRNKKAALKFLRKLMRRYGRPKEIVTDRLPSYRAALRELGWSDLQTTGRWLNNRAENSRITSYNVCYTKLLRPLASSKWQVGILGSVIEPASRGLKI